MNDDIETVLEDNKDERLADALAESACDFLSIATFVKQDRPGAWRIFTEEYDIKEEIYKKFEED